MSRQAATLLLIAAVAFNLLTLWPEVGIETPALNDSVLHLTLVERTVDALARGEDPTDHWVSTFVQGYPLAHHYQHLPHLVTALLYRALGGAVPLTTLFNGLRYLLLSTFPLSIYWAGRRLGGGPLPAALAGSVSSLLSTNGLYGFELGSYVWRGYGMATQLWGMWLLGPAVAHLYTTVRDGRRFTGTVALLAATLLAHTLLGYVALLSGSLFIFLGRASDIGRRMLRLALVFLLVALVASYFLLPFLLDHAFMNRSVWENPDKYDAYGWQWTLWTLCSGQLLDAGRVPSLTLLAGLGLGVCLARWRRDERCRLLVAFFVFWLLLYCGRPTWGVLLNLLPLSRDLHLHRFIAPVHLAAIGLIGGGMAWLLRRAAASGRRWLPVAAGLLMAGLLAPVVVERVRYTATNGQWMRQNAAAFAADEGALDRLLADLRALPPGRVYAGRGGNWGDSYTVGNVPVYALLTVGSFDNPGYLYHSLSFNADIQVYLDESRRATFDLFDLRYIVAPEGQSVPRFARLLGAYGRHRLYTVETSGYFGLVDSDFTFYGTRDEWFAAAQAWMASDWVEARQHPLIVFGPPPADEGTAMLPLSDAPDRIGQLDLPQRESCGRVLDEQVAGNFYSVEFEAHRACWLLLKQTFHPGWRATLDGQPVTISMLAPSFVGVEVTAGRHRAEFRYTPGPLRGWLRALGAAVLALSAVAEWQRRRWEPIVRRWLTPLTRLGAAVRPLAARLSDHVSVAWRGEGRWLAALLLIILLAGLPTLQLRQMSGHDALVYVPRVVEFVRALSEGQIPPRWAPDLSFGYGQPLFIFYPPFIYALAALFHALGSGFVVSLNLACLALLALAGLGMYAFARTLFGRAGGLVAGVGYVFVPFLLVNLYVRHALADFAAMAFIPWALWGLLGWVRWRQTVALAVAVSSIALLLLSSNPLALVTAPTLALYAAFLAGRARSWAALRRGAWAVGLGLGLAAFYWLPALLERQWVNTDNLLTGYLNYGNHFVYLHQLLFSPWGYGLSVAGTADGMSFGLGLAHLALLATSLVLARWWRDGAEGRAHLVFFIVLLGAAVLLVTDNSLWLWERLPLLQYLEFPWRILALAAVAMAFLCGFPFLVVTDRRRRRWLLVGALAALLLTGIPHARPEGYLAIQDADYAPPVIAGKGIETTTTRECEPVWVEERPTSPAPEERLLVASGTVRVLESRPSGTRYEWLLEADGPAQVRVAAFYYPGWRLTVDGEERPLTVDHPTGRIAFALEDGVHRVVVHFGTTPLRSWAVALSLLSLIGLIGTVPLARRSEARPPVQSV